MDSDQSLHAQLDALLQWMKANPWACMGTAVGAGFALGIGGSPKRLLRVGAALAGIGFDIAARVAVLGIMNEPHTQHSSTRA